MTDRESPTRLGATVVSDGVRFAVWAPFARRVEVLVEGHDEPAALDQRTDRAGTPTWEGVVEGARAGDRYRYRLDGGELLADPASLHQPDGVDGPSAVVDPSTFRWTDDGWPGVQLDELILYELHVGTFTPDGTLDGVIGQLDRLVDLGVTAIELMPVNAFPGVRNWGYDGVFVSAVQESYGGPAGLARLVDAAHGLGLGVFVDVVYNHFGPEGNVLPRFGPYLTNRYETPWGGAVNVSDAGSDSVRRLLIESAVGWVTDFHVDGLRIDAVHEIVDPTPSPFVSEVAEAVQRAGAASGRHAIVIVESMMNDPRVVRPRSVNGWGADAVWNDDLHHALRVALTGERHEYYGGYDGASDLATAYEHRWVYRGQHSPTLGRRHGAPAGDIDPAHFVVFSTNHDHVGNTPTGERMGQLHGMEPDDPRLRLAAAAVLLAPFTPMLFMGEEYGETAPFPYFVDHGDAELLESVRRGRQREFSGADWSGDVADPADPATFHSAVLRPSLAQRDEPDGPHRRMLALYRRLIELRRSTPILTDPDAEQIVREDDGVITLIRRSASASTTLVLNLTGSERPAAWAEAGCLLVDTADRTGGLLAPWSARLTTGSASTSSGAVSG